VRGNQEIAMKAWQVTTQGEPSIVMSQTDKELGEVGPGELHVKVAASAIGFPDVLMCRGTYPLTPQLPFTPGQEFVGTVTAAGPGTTLPIGTRVMGVSAFMLGQGAFAEQCNTYEQMIFPIDVAIDDADAAAFTIAYHTAYIGLVRRAKLIAGETVLVHGGAGGTGFAAIQLAKALGARVIATAGGAKKVALCRELGADIAIDYNSTDFSAAVNKETGGRGVDVVFDPVGGEIFENSINCLAHEGRLLPIGFACGRWGEISPALLVFKNASIVGTIAGGFDRDYMLSMHKELLSMYSRGLIKVSLDRKIGFADIRDSMQDLADRKVLGRVVAVY
jgi:NADPH:quinone reductase